MTKNDVLYIGSNEQLMINVRQMLTFLSGRMKEDRTTLTHRRAVDELIAALPAIEQELK